MSNTGKHAVILAGGKGSRLRPYTVVLPKPLMPIGEYPILEVIIRQLAKHGFTTITLAVNHQAELIKAFFSDGNKWGVQIFYSLENEPLGTMGPLKLIQQLPDNFLVMNGDILTNLSYSNFYNTHVVSKALFTISSHKREQMIDYGVLQVNEQQQLIGFTEKPRNHYEVSMGIYMLNKKVLKHIPNKQAFGFDHLMLQLIQQKQTVVVQPFDGLWLDIGRPDDYMQAIEQFDQLKDEFLYE